MFKIYFSDALREDVSYRAHKSLMRVNLFIQCPNRYLLPLGIKEGYFCITLQVPVTKACLNFIKQIILSKFSSNFYLKKKTS